jgi:hypothetical protein
MSKFKDQTGPTPPLSSAESTEEQVPPFSPTVLSVPTTVKLTEKIRQHAMLMRVALLQLEKAGLLKRYKVFEMDEVTGQETLKEYKIVLSPAFWNESLELIEGVVNRDNTFDNSE